MHTEKKKCGTSCRKWISGGCPLASPLAARALGPWARGPEEGLQANIAAADTGNRERGPTLGEIECAGLQLSLFEPRGIDITWPG